MRSENSSASSDPARGRFSLPRLLSFPSTSSRLLSAAFFCGLSVALIGTAGAEPVAATGGGSEGGRGPRFAEESANGLTEDRWGEVARLDATGAAHRVWVNDSVLKHSVLFDGEARVMLGAVDGGTALSTRPPYFAHRRGEIYVVQTIYARGTHGARSDLITIYDDSTLAVLGDIEIPPFVADTGTGVGLGAVLDDERFLVIFNQVPEVSVTVVDLEARAVTERIITGGCAMVYPVDDRRFAMLCGDGSALVVEIDESGRNAGITRSSPFFDVVADPLSVAGVRSDDEWWFVSFDGWLHRVSFRGDAPRLEARWSLIPEDERGDSWRVGGIQHLALHRGSGRLYSLVHQGGRGSHKDAGSEIWVYDVEARERVAEFSAPNVLPGFLRPLIGIGEGGWADRVVRLLAPNPGVHSIAVTQDEEPLLFARNRDIGNVAVVDGRSGEALGDLTECGFSGPLLVVP